MGLLDVNPATVNGQHVMKPPSQFGRSVDKVDKLEMTHIVEGTGASRVVADVETYPISLAVWAGHTLGHHGTGRASVAQDGCSSWGGTFLSQAPPLPLCHGRGW
jgi:hypothetical protein